MRAQYISLYFSVAFLLVCAPSQAQTSPEQSYPGDFALVQNSEGKWTYVKFPELLALYVFDGDEPGKSNCNAGCAAAWPPVLAKDDAEPMGEWTPIVRDNGAKQWAYKEKPVYVYFHDVPGNPQGAEQEGWSLLKF